MTDPPPFSAMLALLAVSHAWEADLAAELRELGLTPRKYALLGHIKATPDISFSELARRSRISVQSVHVAVKALSASGFVDDGTAHAGAASTLRVSDEGREALRHAHRRREALDDRMRDTAPELVTGLEAAVRALMTGAATPQPEEQ
ncbi:winged helix-turn-helix transcriptional regulator [Mycobacterium yunnanensis]|uniref:Winged helix-turn-helix transcriptional regulator n=1 Tax=Mycobacterium yunnanensis TaxID=368477 RepID=A0A9X3BU50_9MYCO|nr:MarR family winged helix-turn-helix transcriptional regulator [Mycobacterium yunnanensis]MCV7422329.1 winged helix-turn-helix transcriptional regulator [Mycobacterium yunnanensis]